MDIREIKISDLKPNPKNPRSISEDALSGLSASIKKFGLVEPIIVNEITGYIVGGHQRLEALKKQGIKETHVVVVNLSEKEEMELNVALNNKAIQGDWTRDLKDILVNIKMDFTTDYDEMCFDSLFVEEFKVDLPDEDNHQQNDNECDIKDSEVDINKADSMRWVVIRYPDRLECSVMPHLEEIKSIEGVKVESS